MSTEAMNEVQRVPSFPGLGITARKLVDFMQSTKSVRLTDEELTAACGRDVRRSDRGGGAGSLASAIRYIINHYGKVWARERMAGCIKLLDDNEKSQLPQRARRVVNRKLNRELKKSATVDRAKLDDRTRRQFDAETAQLAFASHAMSAITAKRLEARAATSAADVQKFLEAMK